MSNYNVGRTRKKLAALIEAQGFRVDPGDLCPAQGAWRTDDRLDTQPWHGKGFAHNHATLPEGSRTYFSSWFTMTELCKAGRVDAKQEDRAPVGHMDVTPWSPT